MSQCGSCFVGQCKRHPLQDHGKREKDLKSKVTNHSETLKKVYETLLKKQVDKCSAETNAVSDQNAYRELQEQARIKAERRGNKLTQEQQEKVKSLRLGGHMIGFMIGSSDEDDKKERGRSEKEKSNKKKRKEKKSRKSEKQKRKSKDNRKRKESNNQSSDTDECGESDGRKKKRRRMEEYIKYDNKRNNNTGSGCDDHSVQVYSKFDKKNVDCIDGIEIKDGKN